ncbi:MAG: flagellar basal body rod protein FlgB [Acetivibrio sp.]
MISNVFNHVNLYGKAADAAWMRNEVITNNMANIDTPNFKRREVSFEQELMSALVDAEGDTLKKKIRDIDVDTLNPKTYKKYENLSYRLDGNNVDIDTESNALAQNQMKYYGLTETIGKKFNGLSMVINGK